MLPIDEDILLSRYGDSPAAAGWYQNARACGLDPLEAIQVTERLIRYADGLPFLSPDQVLAFERYAGTCADAVAVLDDFKGFRQPTDEEVGQLRDLLRTTNPYDPERVRALIEEARRLTALVRERLGS